MAEAQAGQAGTAGAAGTETPPAGAQTPAGGAQGGAAGQPPTQGSQAPQGGAQQPPKELKRAKLEADGEIPEDADLLELSKSSLKSRLNRHTTSELKKRFGTDDVDKIKKDLDELATLRKEKDDKRKAELSELDREKEEHAKTKSRAEAAEARARESYELREFDKEDRRVTKIATAHVDPDHVDYEMAKFARYLRKTYTDKELLKLEGAAFKKVADDYFTQRVKDKPKIGKDYEAKREAEIRQELKDEAAGKKKKEHVTNGADTKGRAAPSKTEVSAGPKTFAPGKPNSYSKEEVDAELRRIGGGRRPY
jgi:hypothetical protein